MASLPRRGFLSVAGGAVAALSGCVSNGLSGGRRAFDATVYVGSYHWGFILLDDTGTEHDRIVFDRGDSVEIVAFNTSAETTLEKLPSAVREAIPDHETLEERNEERIPPPPNGDFHDVLDEANQNAPDHSLAVMPSERNMGHMGEGGMMLHPIPLPADATSTTTARLSASERGDYTPICHRDCGYGHEYMYLDGAFVVE